MAVLASQRQTQPCPPAAPAVPGQSTGLAEYGVALSQGYVLEAPLGSGHFGRVYRARSKTTGQVRSGALLMILS